MIVERAGAKLNLALHVRGRRADGYHEIETLFAFCRDGDTVTVGPADRDAFALTGPFAPLLDDTGDNLVTRSRDAFRAAFGVRAACSIVLDKRLPVAAGIGGGSADAAATLRALATIHDVDHMDPRLMRVARGLGADVPACLAARRAIGRGRGDDLVFIAGTAGVPVLLVNPRVALSTATVFARWDGIDHGAIDPDADPATQRNDLAEPAIRAAPVIAEVLALLRAQAGARLVRMSGSGATCFALFADRDARAAARAAIMRERPQWWAMESELD